MTENSARLALPYLQPSQAQKHVTHNEALARLDILVQLTLETLDAASPPASPAEGAVYGINATPSGDWAAQPGALAAWVDGAWLYFAPQAGWRAWAKAEAALFVYTGSAWANVSGATDFDNLDGVGIGTSSDPINRLAVASQATLLTHDGAGHQIKINKAAAGDTASLLYQTGFSGRAEMGLAGNDDFSIKVSPDGSTFLDGVLIDGTTGEVSFPNSRPKVQAPLAYRYYGYTSTNWVAPTYIPGSENANQQLGDAAEPTVDFDTSGLFLPAGTTVEAMQLNLRVNNAQWADFDIRVFFQHGAWDGSWTGTASTSRDVLHSSDAVGLLTGTGYQRFSPTMTPYVTPEDGHLFIAFKPIGTLTATRYLFVTGQVTVRMADL